MEGLSTSNWKPRHRILAIDPGWENLGVFLLEISDSKEKKFRVFYKTIDLNVKKTATSEDLVDAFNIHLAGPLGFLPDDPNYKIDYILMERQPANYIKNRELEVALRVFLWSKYEVLAVWMYSPISVKNKLGLPVYRKDHSRNKKAMIERISEGEDILFRGLYNDHIADCVGLLNVFFQTHKTLKTMVLQYKEEDF